MSNAAPRSGREIILGWIKKSIASLVLLAAVAYLVDYVVLRIRIAAHETPSAQLRCTLS